MPPQPHTKPAALQYSRTNVSDIKSQIAKQLGPDRAQRYFGYLNGLLSQKLSKAEFDKVCVKILGRENLPLHNQLIRSILRNACQAKVPPLVNQEKGVSRTIGVVVKKSQQIENALNSPQTVNPAPNIFSNGDLLPPSPRKFRSNTQNQRIKDRPSPLVPDGMVEINSHHSSEETVLKENGDVSLSDFKRPFQYQQGVSSEKLAKRPRLEKGSLHDGGYVHSKAVKVVSLEDREHMGHQTDLGSARGPLQAPLGIPCFSASIGSAQRSLLSTSSDSLSRSSESGDLCHTEVLKKRMEKIAKAQGLEGVTLDCANLLNNGLDVYLKQLIRSSVELVGTRIGHIPIKNSVPKLQPYMKPINGVWVDNHIQAQSSNRGSEGSDEMRNNFSITLQDFKLAMDLKPQQLGEDWPSLLEKICIHSFEE